MENERLIPILQAAIDILNHQDENYYSDTPYRSNEILGVLELIKQKLKNEVYLYYQQKQEQKNAINFIQPWSDKELRLLRHLFYFNFNPKRREDFYHSAAALFKCPEAEIKFMLLRLRLISKPYKRKYAYEKIESGRSLTSPLFRRY